MTESWYLATCLGCTPILPMPFRIQDDRNRWVAQHIEATGHTVVSQNGTVNPAARAESLTPSQTRGLMEMKGADRPPDAKEGK